jgi:hypothetical protein
MAVQLSNEADSALDDVAGISAMPLLRGDLCRPSAGAGAHMDTRAETAKRGEEAIEAGGSSNRAGSGENGTRDGAVALGGTPLGSPKPPPPVSCSMVEARTAAAGRWWVRVDAMGRCHRESATLGCTYVCRTLRMTPLPPPRTLVRVHVKYACRVIPRADPRFLS